ncbi:hypothetical protein ABZ468_25910 [Streptomyces sp. NPDC005708]|uniref:hypothetical protein n=1 Tax=Streptomyces sp. NPDC005708 TaxID=3154564 RepID=UPI0033FEBF87
MRISIYRKAKSVMALSGTAARVNGTAAGTTVDRYQAGAAEYRSVMFVVTTATITDGSHAVSVQDSDDGSTWGTPAAGEVQGTAPTIAATDSNKVFDVGYSGAKRYCRIQAVTTGATTGGIFTAAAVLYGTRRDR